MSASVPADGARLIYLMGASGSGKDTLLRLLRAELRGDEPVLVAHRYITRDSGATEDALSLTEDEFGRRAALGCFALRWASHGLHYGIGIEIDAWLSCGAAVIINGSRAHLEQAHSRYPALTAVEVTVDPGQLVRRLA
jgi:ribose 1,5-bisphosphokinase